MNVNTVTLAHTQGRDAVYRLSIEPHHIGYLVIADYGRRDVWTRRVQLSAHEQSHNAAKQLFNRKIEEKRKRGYRIVNP